MEPIHHIHDRRDPVRLHGSLGESRLDDRRDELVRAPPRGLEEVRTVEHDRCLGEHAFLDMAPQVRPVLVGRVQQNVATPEARDLVAPSFERLAKHVQGSVLNFLVNPRNVLAHDAEHDQLHAAQERCDDRE